MPDDPLLRVAGLDVSYGRARVLFDVAFDVARGDTVALLGRNGAGKSTVLKAIMGLVPARAGYIAFAGHRLAGLEPHAIARLGLGYVPEDRRIFGDLTVVENLEVGRRAPRADDQGWTQERLFDLFPELTALRHRAGGRLSGGEQQMLTIARTLMGNPVALLLDEPAEGLAPLVVERLARAIGALAEGGLTIILCDQNVRFAARVARRAIVIDRGRVRHQGPMAELAQDAALRARVLGLAPVNAGEPR